jgi:thioredoxin reductase
MIRTQVAIIGAGPAGLAAAVELAQEQVDVLLIDEQEKPGGQLVKQIHKFFGSHKHYAGIRGIEIADQLFSEAKALGVKILANTAAYGLFGNRQIGIHKPHTYELGIVEADRIILATGASENPLWFPGWTLPGVMGAGAFQTMINVHRVLPGKKVVIVGSGNVGLIVAFQALQAGADVLMICEALPWVGGYEVHAAKVRRQGVPICLRTTIERALGQEGVEKIVLIRLDEHGKPIPGSAREIEADTVCISVGLSPLAELAWMAGCQFCYIDAMGGWIPVHDAWMKTTAENIWVAGDVAGIEEASTAMEEGRLAALGVALSLGVMREETAIDRRKEVTERLTELRMGPFGETRRIAKDPLCGL